MPSRIGASHAVKCKCARPTANRGSLVCLCIGLFAVTLVSLDLCHNFRPLSSRHLLKAQHIDPYEAVQVHKDVRAKHSVAIHWGTFPLAHEVGSLLTNPSHSLHYPLWLPVPTIRTNPLPRNRTRPAHLAVQISPPPSFPASPRGLPSSSSFLLLFFGK